MLMPRPVGRPSKLDKCAACFLKHIEAGQPIASAAALAGLAESTVFAWLADARANQTTKFSEFLESFTRARGKAQAKMVREIRVAGRQDWRAICWLLERLWPEQFNLRQFDPAVSVSVNATATANQPPERTPQQIGKAVSEAFQYIQEHKNDFIKGAGNRFDGNGH